MFLVYFLASLAVIADGQLLSGIKVSSLLLCDQFTGYQHDNVG
jgi:hypothetical protein